MKNPQSLAQPTSAVAHECRVFWKRWTTLCNFQYCSSIRVLVFLNESCVKTSWELTWSTNHSNIWFPCLLQRDLWLIYHQRAKLCTLIPWTWIITWFWCWLSHSEWSQILCVSWENVVFVHNWPQTYLLWWRARLGRMLKIIGGRLCVFMEKEVFLRIPNLKKHINIIWRRILWYLCSSCIFFFFFTFPWCTLVPL